MKFNIFFLLPLFLILISCNLFKSEKAKKIEKLNKELIIINDKYKNQKIQLAEKISNEIFQDKKKEAYSIITYYDANCSVCYIELEKWKDLLPYFKEIDSDINIKFILFSDDEIMTEINLDNSQFPKNLVVFDSRNSYLDTYRHVLTKAYNCMLLDENNEILFIGSPLNSENIKKHYAKLITKS